MDCLEVAKSYVQAGLSVLPAELSTKRPALASWKKYQQRLPTPYELDAWFKQPRPMCVITGAVSGNLEILDFDLAGELFEPWKRLVEESASGLMDRLVVERSQSGGRHVVYRCESDVDKNMRLAQREVEVLSADEVEILGKKYKPRFRKSDDTFVVVLGLIETRGNGGLFLCDPTEGYELEQGRFEEIPVLTTEERERLLEAAWSLNEYFPEPKPTPQLPTERSHGLRPGDDFNERGDVRAILRRHDWKLTRSGENEHWCRPGKKHGTSATFRDGVFYVFSSNAAPFEPEIGHSPFAVYALLEHFGDYSAAATALRAEGYGSEETEQPTTNDVDLSGFQVKTNPDRVNKQGRADPGPIPVELLRIPGFVSEVMDLSLETAAYPNQVLAFCGALAMQSFLAGRKVSDPGDVRSNLYLLGLAYSSGGKDQPRKVNRAIAKHIGVGHCIGDGIASGEGIEDALAATPCMLFQTDEIDAMLHSIKEAKDNRFENIMKTLLTIYSSANSVITKRPLAGRNRTELPIEIDQPSLSLFGTAIPNHFYDALSERMLTNGFFARNIVVESLPRVSGQESSRIRLPQRIKDTATWWNEFLPGSGNLQNWHPEPAVVEFDDAGRRLIAEARIEAESHYSEAESRGDVVGTTVWGRLNEQTRKLALVYAVSENHKTPSITKAAVCWANEFMQHQVRRMLFMAEGHVAVNPFHDLCLKLKDKLRKEDNKSLPHSVALKRMHMDAQSFQRLIDTMKLQGDVESEFVDTSGRRGLHYRLISG